MRKLLLIACIILYSKIIFPQKLSDKKVLKMIYANEETIVKNLTSDIGNYMSIVNFAKKERYKVYRSHNIRLKGTREFIILEGAAGEIYRGLLITNDSAFFYSYQNETKAEWAVNYIALNDINITKRTNINSIIIDKIKNWDVDYINKIKSQLGYYVHDGLSFIATRVKIDDDNKPNIETILFEQF